MPVLAITTLVPNTLGHGAFLADVLCHLSQDQPNADQAVKSSSQLKDGGQISGRPHGGGPIGLRGRPADGDCAYIHPHDAAEDEL